MVGWRAYNSAEEEEKRVEVATKERKKIYRHQKSPSRKANGD